MADLFKFRCFQCQKLIGAPPSKFGKVVHCPRCSAELIVPSPEDQEPPPEEPDPDAFRPEDLGLDLNLGVERLASPKVAPPGPPVTVGPDPIAFLRRVSEAGDVPPSPEPRDEPAPDPGESQDGTNEAPVIPEAVPEPLAGRRRRRAGSALIEPAIRARDVVLPRTAAVAWAMFALLALAFAFTSGLFIGHVLWK